MKLFYKIWFFGVFVFLFLLSSMTFATSVSAGPDITIETGESATLNGEIDGFDDCGDVFYYWTTVDGPKELTIDPDYLLTGSVVISTDDNTDTTGDYLIRLNVNGHYCGDGMIEKTGSDIMTLTIVSPGSGGTSTTGTSTISGGGGESRASKMRREASRIFATTGSIDAINLHLTKRITYPNRLFELNWNYIGGDGAIKYEIQYSTGKDFNTTGKINKYSSQTTKRRSYNIYVHDLNKDSVIHYFRVRAFYKGKYSKRSNVVYYVNEDDPLSKYVVQCKECTKPISFMDVLFDPEVLIEGNLNIQCKAGRKEQIKYKDVINYISLDPQILIESKFNTSCGVVGALGCGRNKLDFSDAIKLFD